MKNITVYGPLASYEVGSTGPASSSARCVQEVAAALLGGAILHGFRGVTVGPWHTAVAGFRGYVTWSDLAGPMPGVESWRDYRGGLYAPIEGQRTDTSAFGAALVFVETVGTTEAFQALARWRERQPKRRNRRRQDGT